MSEQSDDRFTADRPGWYRVGASMRLTNLRRFQQSWCLVCGVQLIRDDVPTGSRHRRWRHMWARLRRST